MTDMVDMFYMLDRHLLIDHTRVFFMPGRDGFLSL